MLPRIKKLLERGCSDSNEPLQTGGSKLAGVTSSEDGHIFFVNDRIYKHKIFRINYTTYDVRRAQDVINPYTSRCNVLLLAEGDGTAPPPHPFLYAQVLGVYHVNAVYAGVGHHDYRPYRMEFLWVRWLQVVESEPCGWEARRLDCLRYLPLADEHAFGFVDPADVLRGFHLIPRFVHGRRQEDGISLSRCAKDGRDWRMYFANRC